MSKNANQHSYEVAEIETLDMVPSVKNGAHMSTSSNREGTCEVAKLLKGVEKSNSYEVKFYVYTLK